MKPVVFEGDSRQALRGFPAVARRMAGFEIERVQRGMEPTSWKPMRSIGRGVQEIRLRHASGSYRVIYLAKLAETVFVLHAFQKKSQKTARGDIGLATQRYRLLLLRLKYEAQGD